MANTNETIITFPRLNETAPAFNAVTTCSGLIAADSLKNRANSVQTVLALFNH